MRATAIVQALHFLMPLPTLFFTLITYALHEVTYVTAPPFKGGDKSNHQLRMHSEAVERSMNRCKTTLYETGFRAIGSS
jgi:hypothetical protein